MITDDLQRLVEEVGKAMADGDPGCDLAVRRRVGDALGERLQRPDLLPTALLDYSDLAPSGIVPFLLHREARFVVFAVVTGGSLVLPPHDHGSWGVVGIHSGSEEEVRYRPVEADFPGSLVGLAEMSRRTLQAGEISTIHPPQVDIHAVANRSTTNSVSVHIFGRDPMEHGFNQFVPSWASVPTGPMPYRALP